MQIRIDKIMVGIFFIALWNRRVGFTEHAWPQEILIINKSGVVRPRLFTPAGETGLKLLDKL